MEWTDILIVVLMMLTPVLGAILDRKAKKARASRPVQTPIPEPEDEWPPRDAASHRRDFRVEFPAPEPAPASEPSSFNVAANAEGQRAVEHRESTPEPAAKQRPASKKGFDAGDIDVEKLIVYSEILKPRFDS